VLNVDVSSLCINLSNLTVLVLIYGNAPPMSVPLVTEVIH